MTAPTTESALQLSPVVTIATGSVPSASGIEEEVLFHFDEFRDPLLRYVCGFGVSLRDGEDLVQEIFLALFRHFARDGSRSNLRAWLFRVAQNLALKHVGRERRRLGRILTFEAAYGVPDPRQDLEGDLVRREQHKRLVAVLEAA